MKLPLQDYVELLAKYLRPQRNRVILLAALIFGGIGLQLLSPQIVRGFIDTAQAFGANQQAEVTAALRRDGLLFLLVTLTAQVVRLSGAYVTEDVKWRATNWLRNDLSDHCMRLDMSFHNEFTPGAMIERVDGDVQELSEFMSQFVLRVLANALLLVGILILLYREQWQIGLAFTLYSVVMFTILIRTVKIGVPFWEAEREASSQMFGYIEEWLNGTEDIRASGGIEYVLDRLRRAIYSLFLATRKAFFAGMLTWGLSGMLFTVNLALALGIGAYFLQAGAITIGTVYLIMSYSNTLQRPIQQLSRQLQDLQAATASIGRIRELMALESAVPDAPNAVQLPAGPLRVEFDDVSFGYNAAEPVLRHVDFTLAPGRVLGLLGRTGSGKTTITRLLFRLYDPQLGAISLGDHNLREAPLVMRKEAFGEHDRMAGDTPRMETGLMLAQVKRGYSGQGGPLTPLTFSTKGEEPSADASRANRIINQMDRLNLYRIAATKAPFAIPVKDGFRFTSGFGYRRDPKTGGKRLHKGVDFAGPVGTALYATADGVVTHAGWGSGYGRLVKIQHEFGIETRYAHMSKIRVKVGQRVSRGERIGDMGASGRVTGPHLHYEVRIGGEAVNPMTYIKAANNVF